MNEIELKDDVDVGQIAGKSSVPKGLDDELEEEIHLNYEDLNFEKLRKHPKVQQYQHSATGAGSSQSRLQLILSAITGQFQTAQTPAGLPGQPERAIEPQNEESEEESEARLQREERRHLSQQQRTRRIFKNFVRRYLRGLRNLRFQELVGPMVMAKNSIIFGHLLLQLSRKEWFEDDQDFIIGAFLEMWRGFWGDLERPGYYGCLGGGERQQVRELVTAYRADSKLLATLLRSNRIVVANHWEKRRYGVRDIWRALLSNLPFHLGREVLREAWRLAGELEEESESIPQKALAELEALANFETNGDFRHYLETKYRLAPGSSSMDMVKLDPKLSTSPLENLNLSDPQAMNDQHNAIEMLKDWMAHVARSKTRKNLYRISCIDRNTGQAEKLLLYDPAKQEGRYYNASLHGHHADAAKVSGPIALPRTVWELTLESVRNGLPVSSWA